MLLIMTLQRGSRPPDPSARVSRSSSSILVRFSGSGGRDLPVPWEHTARTLQAFRMCCLSLPIPILCLNPPISHISHITLSHVSSPSQQ